MNATPTSTTALLQEEPAWMRIQKQTFTRWVHMQLDVDADGDGEVDDDKMNEALPLEEVFKTGVNLIHVLEKHTGKSLGKSYKNPTLKIQQVDNIGIGFKFMEKNGIKLVNICNEDVWNGNSKLICGLVWTIIYEFQLSRMDIDGKKNPKEALLEWIQSKIPEENITNFGANWRSGTAVCALTNALGRELYGGETVLPDVVPGDAAGNATKGINAAHKKLAVGKLLTAEMLTSPDCDEHSMVAYLSLFRDAHVPGETEEEKAARLRCEADRIEAERAAIAEEEALQLLEAERIKQEQLAAQEAAAAKAAADAQAAAEAKAAADAAAAAEAARLESEAKAAADAKAKAEEEARLAIPPPMDRDRATWRPYEGEDLGGRCRIRVYYSTTTSDRTIRQNTMDMDSLLVEKEVHLRPDFEPNVPVDVNMEREFRNKIFEKAGGLRVTPMLFVDDEFVGGYDKVLEMNASGALDRLLAY